MFRRTRIPLLLATVALAAAGLTACGSSDPLSSGKGGGGSDSITIGSANFPESELLMDIYAQALQAKGVKVTTKPNIGAREVYMKAFEDGSIDLLPEYNGALLAYLEPKVPAKITSPDAVYKELQTVLPKGSETLPQSAAQDVDTLTVTKETAEKYHLTSISDLKPVASKLTVGAGPEFKKRYQGLVGLKDLYGVTFKAFKPLDSGGPLTIAALKKGDVDVADIFSTDYNIAANGWVSLTDPKNLYLAENVVPLIRSDKASAKVKTALDAVSQALTTQNLTEALEKVQKDKQDPLTVAKGFLSDHNLS